MAAWTYDESVRRLLAHEGGYSNHPSDPGGPTNFGITIHDYRKYIDAGGTAADVRKMSVGQAKAIYRSKYWNAMHCDELPAGVDYAVFDYGVNSGTGRAPKVLKRVIGLDASNSVVTPQAIETVRRRDAKAVVNAICDERLRFLKALRTWAVFGAGWSRRVSEVRTAALAMINRAPQDRSHAADAAGSSAAARAPASGKGTVPVNRPAQTGTTGVAGTAGAAAAAQSNEPVLIAVILVVTVAAAIGAWLFWRWWQQRQQDAPA